MSGLYQTGKRWYRALYPHQRRTLDTALGLTAYNTLSNPKPRAMPKYATKRKFVRKSAPKRKRVYTKRSKPAIKRRRYVKSKKPLKRQTRYNKPPRAFVKKVEAVLNKDMPCGMMTSIGTWDTPANASLANQYRQTVATVFNNSLNANWFSWAQVADAAAIMFNGKAITENSQATLTGNFDTNVKIFVESQYVAINVLNNFNTGGTIKCLTCTPKNDNNLTTADPAQCWNDAKKAYVNINFASTATQADCSAIFDTPSMYHAFNSAFSVHTDSVYLAPGKQHRFVRNGKAGVYDFTRAKTNFADTTYNINAKGYNQWTMFVWVPDIVQVNFAGGTSNQIARQSSIGNPTSSTPGDLVFEYKYHCCIRAPDETPVANKHQVLSFNNFATVQTTALAKGVRAEKPIAQYAVTA